MRLLVCGSRDYTNREAVKREILEIRNDGYWIILLHGGARGADTLAGVIAADFDIDVVVFQAEWGRYGKSAGPIRNQRMLDEGKPDMVLAFTTHLETSNGTRDMVMRANKAGIEVRIIAR